MLLAAGALAGDGRLGLVSVLVAGMVGSLLADTCWYVIGRKGGRRVLGWLYRMSLEPDTCVAKTSRIFAARGARALVVAKFVPGFNTIASPLAGVVRMPVADFLVFSALGAAVWAGVFVGLGWRFSSQLEVVEGWIDWLGGWAFGVVAIVVVGYVAWKFIGRRRFLRRIRIARITPEELKKKLDGGEDMVVVDVRDRSEFEAEPAIIPGALHLATDELETRHHEIPRGRDIVLYCTWPNEAASARVALLLRRRGIERVRPLAGGFHAWRDRGYPMMTLTPAISLAPAISGGSSHA